MSFNRIGDAISERTIEFKNNIVLFLYCPVLLVIVSLDDLNFFIVNHNSKFFVGIFK